MIVRQDFSLVSGTLQHTANKISSVGGQPAPKGRPKNTVKDDSVVQINTSKNVSLYRDAFGVIRLGNLDVRTSRDNQ